MTPACATPLPMDPPAIVAAYARQADHVEVFRARLVGDGDRIVQVRGAGPTRLVLLHAGCEIGAATLDPADTFAIVPDVLPGRDLVELRGRATRTLRYLGAVDGQGRELLMVPDATSVHFVQGPDGAARLGVVRGPELGGRGTIDLYRFDGATFVPDALAPPAATPAYAPCPADRIVRGTASSLRVPQAPVEEDGSPTTAPWTTDRWSMDLSDATGLDVVLQARVDGGPRATWVFRPEGERRWCRMGPVLDGVDVDEEGTRLLAPRFSAEVGVLPDRAVLVSREGGEYGGNGCIRMEDEAITAVVGADLRAIATISVGSAGHGGAGIGGSSRRTWQILPTRPGEAGTLAIALDVNAVGEPPGSSGSLQIYRFDGERYVPWLAALPSTERTYAEEPDVIGAVDTMPW